ncbi:MAG: hypothetical protein JST55_10620 [Bacteroidetes bacterium]|nr:hypothetical protein [Bacteroidota bacterium]
MISKNLIFILKKFTKDELSRFTHFVDSPYFNKQNHVKVLLDYLSSLYPEFPDNDLAKEKIFAKIYPGEKFVESRIRNFCSDLKLLAEKFMMIELLQKDDNGTDLYKLASFNAKRHYGLFQKKYEEVINKKGKEPADEWAINNNIKLYDLRFAYLNANSGDAKETEEILKKINDESLKFYLSFFFKNSSRILNKQRTFFNYGYSPKNFETACGIIENNFDDFKNESYLMLNYYSAMLYKNYDEKSFITLYKFILKNFKKINSGDATDILIALINYCRTQALKGNSEYEFKALEIYKLMESNNIWNKDNLLRPSVYRGATSVGCNCGEFEWTKDFLNKFKDMQPEEHRESNYNLCFGRLYFDSKNYNKAIESLAKVKNEDSSYKYETDALLMKIYYEIDETEALFSKIDSFRHWINNNETIISDRYRKIFKQMVGCIDKLAKLKLKPDSFNLDKLKKKIIADESIVNRLWMIEKINELLR